MEAVMRRILLIDDDDDVRTVLAAALRYAGFEVVTAADGTEGIGLFQQQAVDLVITDLFMPRKDGAETITAIRRLNPFFKIIAISGGGQMVKPEYLEPVVASLGVDRYLTKPLSGASLLAAVSGLLNQPPRSAS
jgi:CheY-like chemotaxis protein